ncbi:MAG: TonB family protein [Pseudomonadota bacterium]|nr:TonB family protein [Pseudomonadota bacterium]
MLAYAPNNRSAARAGSARTLLLVVAGHAVLLALVLTARGHVAERLPFTETDITFIDPVAPPPPPPPEPSQPRSYTRSRVDTPTVIVPIPQPAPPALDRGPPIADPTPFIGNAIVPQPVPLPLDPPTPVIVRKAARFITPADDIPPPYPQVKRESEQEATLRLSLAIDVRGRVTSVEPVGATDPLFLDAARRHILRRWRYQPATEGGRAVATRITVTLKFELED